MHNDEKKGKKENMNRREKQLMHGWDQVTV